MRFKNLFTVIEQFKKSCKRFRNSCTKFVGTIFIILNTHFKALEHYENTKLGIKLFI